MRRLQALRTGCFGLLVSLFACGDHGEAGADDAVGDTDAIPCDNCDAECDAGVCTAQCPVGSDCGVSCVADLVCEAISCRDSDITCEVSCEADAQCPYVDCSGANNCEVDCSGSSSCAIDCTGANNCDQMECSEGAACLMACSGANNCEFEVCTAGATSCDGDVVVCGRACPTCGDGLCDFVEGPNSCADDCPA